LALQGTQIEVRVTERAAVHPSLYPVVVHSEGTQYDMPVLTPKTVIVFPHPLSFKVQEDGVDKLHDIIVPKARHQASDLPEIAK
jgi:hypothetical protein